MSKGNNINVKLKDLKNYMCNEINQIIKDNQQLNSTVKNDSKLSKIEKLKPSKHRMAYKINNNCGKRRYPMPTVR